MESMIKPLNDQVATLEKEVVHLKSLNEDLIEREQNSRKKIQDAHDELHEKSEMFINAGDNLAKKDEELNFIRGQLETNTERMFKNEYENEAHKKRLYEAVFNVRELTEVNHKLSTQIASMEKHEYERETTWIAEIHKNTKMREKLKETEEDLLHHKSTVLFGLQNQVETQELKILKQEEDAKARKADHERDTKLFKEERQQLNIRIELLQKQLRVAKAELAAAQKAEASVRATNINLLTR